MSFVIGNAAPRIADSHGNGFVSRDGVEFYRIADVDRMPPFFVNVVSDCDIWMYVSSRGGMTAGRRDPEAAIFPYETVDRLHDGHAHTGWTSQFWIQTEGGRKWFWEPFAELRPGQSERHRSLYKSLVGNQLVFEEQIPGRQLIFRTRWAAAERLGIVRTTQVMNDSEAPVRISVMDGLRNVLPWGIPLGTYRFASCLTDAYKRTECDAATRLGIFAITAGISDGTHPVEVLRANVVWSVGLPDSHICLSPEALTSFREGAMPTAENLHTGRRGNYFLVNPASVIPPGQSLVWHCIADVGYGHVPLMELREALLAGKYTCDVVEQAIEAGTNRLVANVASGDGLQQTADKVACVHHFANVLFNNMRGGVFVDNHSIGAEDFRSFVAAQNTDVAGQCADRLRSIPEVSTPRRLAEALADANDPRLVRLAYEFLPITFSRRHGDPSRPWNQFSICLKDDAGRPTLGYQGNWRDIFQNWEGLCQSFPGFLESVLSKFLNGSTKDGFNPYRVLNTGMEWEELDPDDPWSNIGYWGDHQIIYLLKLLEALDDRQPGRLHELLACDRFVYLDVPYRIKPYEELVRNGRDTILFDKDRARDVAKRVSLLGADGKLVPDSRGQIRHVNLTEKLLVPMLSKLSNFVLGGGIWMNTQRPEWNDANNALVGTGVSVVTLCYLRRYLNFCRALFAQAGGDHYAVSKSVLTWMTRVQATLKSYRDRLGEPVSPQSRRDMLDQLGEAFSDYRRDMFEDAAWDRSEVAASEIRDFCDLACQFADDTIRQSHREDCLYHAYNLLEFSDREVTLRHLYEMLEGQVAVLSSGTLGAEQAADLLDALFLSRMYREDQQSFMLYPVRELADFLDRNVIPETQVAENQLLQTLLARGDHSLVCQDAMGIFRFAADLQHKGNVEQRLAQLAADKPPLRNTIEQCGPTVVALFENVFQHTSYTGRSGTMYGYEGLGCIYWHMVSKLLLATQENYFWALDGGANEDVLRRLATAYYRVRAGLGPEKSPQTFGAFPTDPYSHSPGHAGAQQPGMTGQVKEEILTRFGELGVRLRNGQLEFDPKLLRGSEFSAAAAEFRYVDQASVVRSLDVPEQGLAFTYCQIPVIYLLTDGAPQVRVVGEGGEITTVNGTRLDAELTQRVLLRDGSVVRLEVEIPFSCLRASPDSATE